MLNFKKTYNFPFRYSVPNYTEKFLNQVGFFTRLFKYFKRCLYMAIMGQSSLELTNILPEHKKILWINVSAPSLGDSLMDLSSRVLLTNKNVDLFIAKKASELYLNDNKFNNVYTDIELVSKNKYSLVIIDSFSTRSIRIKSMIAPKTNFIAMYGYFNGPEVNRVLYSFHQMNHLLGYPKSENEINSSAKCSISISNVDKKVINNSNLPDDFITIVIGGEWEYRTYKKWDKVIEYVLKNNNKLNIVLIGSKNAEEDARKIWSKFPSRNIFNCIANFSFNQTAEIISKSKIVLCCDGGLMHAANSFNKTIIPLFARLEPNMQLTKCIKAFSLYDEQDVNNISVESIIEKYAEATSSFDNHLQGE